MLPSKGLKTIVELKAHNNPALKDFPTAEVCVDEIVVVVVVVVVIHIMFKLNFQSFPHIRVVRPSYAYHCCQFMPSTYENLVFTIIIIIIIIFIIISTFIIIINILKVPEYADFGDLREDIFFPGEFDLSQFGNQTMPSVIWSTSGASS